MQSPVIVHRGWCTNTRFTHSGGERAASRQVSTFFLAAYMRIELGLFMQKPLVHAAKPSDRNLCMESMGMRLVIGRD